VTTALLLIVLVALAVVGLRSVLVAR